MIDCNEPGPANLGNPGEYTVAELVEMSIRSTGSSSKLVYHPLPTDDPSHRRPVIARARERLNWSPEVSIEDGLQYTVEWFRPRPVEVNAAAAVLARGQRSQASGFRAQHCATPLVVHMHEVVEYTRRIVRLVISLSPRKEQYNGHATEARGLLYSE